MTDLEKLVDLLRYGDVDVNEHGGWKFVNLLPANNSDILKSTGATIEWRQPPGVTTAAECFVWTEFVVAFVQAARYWSKIGEEISGYAEDVEGLKKFVMDRGRYPGRNMAYLETVFEGKSGAVKVDKPKRPVWYQLEEFDAEGDDPGRISAALLDRLRDL